MKRNILAYSVLSALLSSAPAAFAQTLEALKESSGGRFGEGRGLPPGGDGVKGNFGGGPRPNVGAELRHDDGRGDGRRDDDRGHDRGRDGERERDRERNEQREREERRREEWRREGAERRRAENRANNIAAGVVLGALAINSMASCAAEQARNQPQDPPAIEQTTDGVQYGR